jgi:hypothetical protein
MTLIVDWKSNFPLRTAVHERAYFSRLYLTDDQQATFLLSQISMISMRGVMSKTAAPALLLEAE